MVKRSSPSWSLTWTSQPIPMSVMVGIRVDLLDPDDL